MDLLALVVIAAIVLYFFNNGKKYKPSWKPRPANYEQLEHSQEQIIAANAGGFEPKTLLNRSEQIRVTCS